jgi:hypothetical protein
MPNVRVLYRPLGYLPSVATLTKHEVEAPPLELPLCLIVRPSRPLLGPRTCEYTIYYGHNNSFFLFGSGI